MHTDPTVPTAVVKAVGISVIPCADALSRTRELVRVADEGGLALVGVQDHPYQRHFFDTWWWAETFASFDDDGFDNVIFWPVDPTPIQVERLAGEVVPMLVDPVPEPGGPP